MSTVRQPLGPFMIDILGLSLSEIDIERLCHPLVGGIILFARNYENPQQLRALCDAIHGLRVPALPVTIDHEGGRVQRCRDGFTRLPAMRELGLWWDEDAAAAIEAACTIGYVLAAELRQCGVDFSFTPVLDLEWGRSSVIGDRAFHSSAIAATELAGGLIGGLRQAGMGCCGKHFPGHGWVAADSHIALPVDERSLAELATDMSPYRHLRLDAVMPAHVIYPQVDALPAGFSRVWLDLLRTELGFDGVIFSDDLSMEGASVAGGIVDRANAAWAAGCDALLVCNAPESVDELIECWQHAPDARRAGRLERLSPTTDLALDSERYRQGQAAIEKLVARRPVSTN